jgi:hypothetical protein
MGKWKNVKITVEQTIVVDAYQKVLTGDVSPKIFEIERPMQRDGKVCIGGEWVTPELKDGKYIYRQQIPLNQIAKNKKMSPAEAAKFITMMSMSGML